MFRGGYIYERFASRVCNDAHRRTKHRRGRSDYFLAKRTSRRFLSVSLGFSAGVMIYVSMVEILATERESLARQWGARRRRATVAAFFWGILLIAIIDGIDSSEENPHEVRLVESEQESAPQPQKD